VGFRDETDAQREHVARLERELASTTAERDEAVRDHEEAKPRLRRLTELEAENAQLRAGLLPGARRARMLTVLVAAVGAAGFVAMLLANRADMTAARQTNELLSRTLEEERARRATAESILPVPVPRPVTGFPSPPPDDEARARARLVGELFESREALSPGVLRRFEEARITAAEGETELVTGERCSVTLTRVNAYMCSIDAVCGTTDVYPGAGHAGFFGCHVGEGADFDGSDIHTSDISGDPMLVLEGTAGTLEISDGPTHPWTVTIALGVEGPDVVP